MIKFLVIINPKNLNDNSSIIEKINNLLSEQEISFAIALTSAENSTSDILKSYDNIPEVILVFGGDGTVLSVMSYLYKNNLYNKTKIGILPGGTANVMSKEVGISDNTIDLISKIVNNEYSTYKIDVGICNDEPFFLRISIGLLAKMVIDASEFSKSIMGMYAYPLAILEEVFTQKIDDISVDIYLNDTKIKVKTASILINNSGNVGIKGISLFDDISINDGSLDMVRIDDMTISNILKNTSLKIAGIEDLEGLERWKVKKVIIESDQKLDILIDDEVKKFKKLGISIKPSIISIIKPN